MAKERAFAEPARKAAPPLAVGRPPETAPEAERARGAEGDERGRLVRGASRAGPSIATDMESGLPGRAESMRSLQQTLGTAQINRMMGRDSPGTDGSTVRRKAEGPANETLPESLQDVLREPGQSLDAG